MAIEYIYPPFEIIRRDERCTRCRICEKQCANGVHTPTTPSERSCSQTNPNA